MDWIANQLSLFFEYKQVENKNKLGDKDKWETRHS